MNVYGVVTWNTDGYIIIIIIIIEKRLLSDDGLQCFLPSHHVVHLLHIYRNQQLHT